VKGRALAEIAYRKVVAAGGQTVRVSESSVVARGAAAGVAIAGVWGAAYAVATAVVPPGFEGEDLERSVTAAVALAVVGSLLAGALLARRLRLAHPWLFAAVGLLLTMMVALCGYGIARESSLSVGCAFFVACVTAVYAGSAALVGRDAS
jgi:hypothetical protein